MSALRPWSAEPGTRSGEMQDFIAGAAVVRECRVFGIALKTGSYEPAALIAAVPPESAKLAKLTADHERGIVEGVDYFMRWVTMLPNDDEPYALARLDLRFAGPSKFEARLLFDINTHINALWAAAHGGWVQLVSPDRLPRRPDIMIEREDFPRALMLKTNASALADTLVKLGVKSF